MSEKRGELETFMGGGQITQFCLSSLPQRNQKLERALLGIVNNFSCLDQEKFCLWTLLAIHRNSL